MHNFLHHDYGKQWNELKILYNIAASILYNWFSAITQNTCTMSIGYFIRKSFPHIRNHWLEKFLKKYWPFCNLQLKLQVEAKNEKMYQVVRTITGILSNLLFSILYWSCSFAPLSFFLIFQLISLINTITYVRTPSCFKTRPKNAF